MKYLYLTIVIIFLFVCCQQNSNQKQKDEIKYKISIAEWSLHRNLRAKKIDNLDFARIAVDSFAIHHVEYVSQFFQDKAENFDYLDQMKDSCAKYGVNNLLIMIDGEGDLGNTVEEKRKESVNNHIKWIKAAEYLGCYAIRVNGNGFGSFDSVKQSLVTSLTELSKIGKNHNINIIVENHGMTMPDNSWSSESPSTNGKWLADALAKVNMENCGALPDFGNFYSYDRYQGLTDLMPFAKGISAKTNNFTETGEETVIDFNRMFDIIHKSKFNGFIGVEYEGDASNGLTEYQGIRKTISLIKKYYN